MKRTTLSRCRTSGPAVPALDLTPTGHLPHVVTTAQHPDAASIILQLEQGHAAMNRAGLGDANLDAFHAEIIGQIAASDDPKATLDAIVQLMRDHRTEGAKCHVYPAWCMQTDDHDDHGSVDHEIVDTVGTSIVDARIWHFSGGTPTVCIGESDFTPEQARGKAAELRQLADRVEELAGHVERAIQNRAEAGA